MGHTFAAFSRMHGDENADPNVWGGKGAGLLKMGAAGINIPPGIVISIDAIKDFQEEEQPGSSAKHWAGIARQHVAALTDDVSLYSVRSGAPISMPGMMDTVLNIGLTAASLPHWIDKLGARTAYDCERRLVQMLATTAFGMSGAIFEEALTALRLREGVSTDAELSTGGLCELAVSYRDMFEIEKGIPFPDTFHEQMQAAIHAVAASWNTGRAKHYRHLKGLPDDMGTACVIQQMVFGNMNDRSGTGVLFSRNPSSGAPGIFGEYLVNAQGEDVVAGIRTPQPFADMLASPKSTCWPKVHASLTATASKLEAAYRDMVDIEFTVQDGEVFILQVRAGKRSALAAFKIAAQLLRDGVIDEVEAVTERLTAAQFKLVQQPIIDPAFTQVPDLCGLAACSGVVSGVAVFDMAEIDACKAAKKRAILLRMETDPDDIALMSAADAVLTVRGGATCHAAVVARSMDKPCVVGCGDLPFAAIEAEAQANLPTTLTIDGSSGRVWYGEAPVIDGAADEDVRFLTEAVFETAGYARQVTVPCSMRHVHQRICVSRWWGDTNLLCEVLQEVRNDPASYTLDLACDNERPHFDEMAFGVGSVDLWMICVLRALREHPIAGLTIANAPENAHVALREAGYRVPTVQLSKTVADFLEGYDFSEEFVTKVLGGAKVLEKLQPMTKGAVRLKNAAPLDYVMFKALDGSLALTE